MQINLNALADYMLEVVDCSAEFEEDEFAISFDGQRLYVERKRSHFNIHVGADLLKLPRC